jgi:hypothetical protein
MAPERRASSASAARGLRWLEVCLAAVPALALAFGSYVAIRADLATLYANVAAATVAAQRANDRIDTHFQQGAKQ